MDIERPKCLANGCERAAISNKLCALHQKQVYVGKIPPVPGATARPNPPCGFDGCENLASTRRSGLCHTHNLMLRDKGLLAPTQMKNKGRTCIVPDCDTESKVKGRCMKHYLAARSNPKGWSPCVFIGCANAGRGAGGYCGPHNEQLRTCHRMWTLGEPPPPIEPNPCGVSGCTKFASSVKGILCPNHAGRARKHHIPVSKFIEMFTDPKCAACGSVDNLHIDHDHECCPTRGGKSCGKCIRGLLCGGCNTALGLLGEDAQRILSLLDYLRFIKPNSTTRTELPKA